MSDEGTKKKVTTPEALSHEIFNQALQEACGGEHEASVSVMRFLTEALVYSAGMSVGGDEIALKGVLKHLAEAIATAPVHPIVAAVAADRAARKRKPAGDRLDLALFLHDAGAKLHPAYEAFCRQLRGRVYEEEKLNDAWTYFKQGWTGGNGEGEIK